MALRTKPRAAVVHARRLLRPLANQADWLSSRYARADLAIFHEYAPSPSGGGNQFIGALSRELRRRGVEIENNRISGGTMRCLFNSFNFDFGRLQRFVRTEVCMVHRVDGPIGVYRGFDDGTDLRILEINRKLADATVFQSRFSLEKHEELGLILKSPVVIPNAPDPAIFYDSDSRPSPAGRRLRVIASSWSANRRKGADVLEWIDEHLDHDRFEVTFVGQTSARLSRIRVIRPLASEALAELLRSQDVYLAASRDDPCSNALLEALACGLPAAYLRSGGHPELVKDGGIGFDAPEELPATLARMEEELEARRESIVVPALEDVAGRYLEVLAR